jgi:hypothetical protein
MITYTIPTPASIPVGSTVIAPSTATILDLRYALDGGTTAAGRIAILISSAAGNTTGALTVIFSTSIDGGVHFDTPGQSIMQLAATPEGASEVQVSDWLQLQGTTHLMVSQINNTSAAAISVQVLLGLTTR